MLDGDLALHDQVHAVRATIWVVEELREDLGGQPERRVRDHTERSSRRPESTKVCVDDASAGMWTATSDVPPQHRCPHGVAFHCPHLGAGVEQRNGQRAGARAEIDDELTATEVEGTDEPVDRRSINEEVLAELATPRVALGRLSPGHGPSPE